MEQIENMEIVNSNRAWVVSEFEKLHSEWLSWEKQVAAIVDQPYDRNTESAVFADGKDMMLKHDVLQAKTLTFLNNNVRGHGFIRGLNGQHIDRTDLRLKIRVEHRMRDLEVLRGALLAGYADSGSQKVAGEAIPSPHLSTNVVAKFKEHSFIVLFCVCVAVAGATWAVCFQVLVSPRDFEITRLKEALAQAQAIPKAANGASTAPPATQMLLSYPSVPVGNSITTPDGACTVHVLAADQATATLEVVVDAEAPKIFKDVKIGGRTVVHGIRKSYYIDLHGARGNYVDLSVSSAPPTGASSN